MSTGLYTADTPDLLTRSLTHVGRAWLTTTTNPPMLLELERLQVGWAERRAPRVQASLSIRLPTDQAILDLFDSRTGSRVEIHAGYVRPGGIEDVQTIADLGLRSRLVSRPSNRLDLTAASDEALVIDASPVAFGEATTSTHSSGMISQINAALSPDPVVNVTLTGGSVTFGGTDRWGIIDDLADRINADVYDDGLRAWWITPRPVLAGTPDLTLTVGQGGTVISSDAALDRATWFNVAHLRYRWTTLAGVDNEVTAIRGVTSGPYAFTGPAGRKTWFEDREVATTQAAANAAGDALVRRFLSRSRTYRLRAIAAYWLRPGMTVTVQLPLGDPEAHLVSSVLFDPLAGSMDVTTRLPDTTSTIAGA